VRWDYEKGGADYDLQDEVGGLRGKMKMEGY
jgi:hypothetical protein